jgi:hypothetical protein
VQRRPRPNRRRGLLRALIAAIVLIVVVVGILLLVSSLTAPAAKAPAVPTTPTTSAVTPSTTAIPTIGTKKTAPGTSKPKASSTSKKKDIALSSRPPGLAFRIPTPSGASASASPDGRLVVYFGGGGDAYARTPVKVWNRATGATRTLSYGDRLIRPVWSRNGTAVLFARVAKTAAYPGARWTLVRANVATGNVQVLDNRNALNLAPLGWRHGQPVYLVATASDTGIFTFARGHPSFVSILMPQVVTNPTLSPDGRYLGFGAPSDCFFCTYDDFDFKLLHTTVGPSGGGSERDMAWSRSNNLLAVPLRDQIAVLQPPELSVVDKYPAPPGLPRAWPHPMIFTEKGRTLTLIDTVTHAAYSATR